MLKNDIRSRFDKNLFSNSIHKKRKDFKNIDSIIFPIEKGFHNFLQKSKEEQVEISKYLLCDLSFSTFASPPNVFIRNLLSLQDEENTISTESNYYPRDHVIHKVYLYLLGIYLYTYSDLFFTKINNKLSRIKKKYSLSKKDNFSLFSSIWKHFSTFHDIGYPVERMNVTALTPHINEHIIPDLKNIKECYVDEMILRIVANLVSISTVTSVKESFDFKSQVYDHIAEEDKLELNKQLTGDLLERLLKSRPYIHLNSLKHARLVSILSDECNIISVVEDAVTGELLIICSLDGSVRINLLDCKNADKVYKEAFLNDQTSQKYLLKFYLINSEYSVLNPMKESYGDDFAKDLQAIRTEVEQNKLYDTYQSGSDNISDMLNFIAYSIITSSKFVDYKSKDRYKKKDFIDVIQDSFNELEVKYPEMIGKQVELEIAKRIKSGSYQFSNIIRTNKPGDVYKKIIFSTFEFDSIQSKTFKDIKKNILSDVTYSKNNVDKLKIDLSKTFDKHFLNNELYKKLITNIESEIAPLVESKLRASNSMSGLFSHLKPSLVRILSNAIDKCFIFELIAGCNYEETTDLHRIFKESLKSVVLDKVTKEDKELYERIVISFKPNWGIDHGFFSSLVYLGNLELVHNVLEIINKGELSVKDKKLVDLIFFNNSLCNYNELINEVLLCAEICFRSILLHNFYPDVTDEFKDFAHDINTNPFTYFSALCDGLQMGGRPVQYNKGIKDFKGFKPDDYYDIEVLSDKISVFINKDYIDDFKLSDISSKMSGYLKNFNSFIKLATR